MSTAPASRVSDGRRGERGERGEGVGGGGGLWRLFECGPVRLHRHATARVHARVACIGMAKALSIGFGMTCIFCHVVVRIRSVTFL